MKALELLKEIRNKENNYDHLKTHKFDEAIEEMEFYMSKRNSYPPCDACGKEVDYMPWHYSTKKERHLHSCDECWELIKDKFTLKG